jgi:ferric-dicitrate binding protein FerR (iron transport regulator)
LLHCQNANACTIEEEIERRTARKLRSVAAHTKGHQKDARRKKNEDATQREEAKKKRKETRENRCCLPLLPLAPVKQIIRHIKLNKLKLLKRRRRTRRRKGHKAAACLLPACSALLACIAPRQKAIKKTHYEEKTEERRTKTPHSEKKKPRKSGTGGKRCVLAAACYCRLPGHRAESIEEIETKGDANRKPQTRAG